MEAPRPSSSEFEEESLSPTAALKLLRHWIVVALESKKRGDDTQYNTLLQELDNIFTDTAQLRLFVQCVSYFDQRAHEALLTQLLGTSLWTCSNEVADVILEFAVNLVAANGATLHQCLEMLVRNFLPPSCGLPAFMGATRRGDPTGVAAIMKARERRVEEVARKDAVLVRVHATLERMMELVPTAPTRLQPIIMQKMPHRRVEKEFQSLYMDALFRLAESKAGAALQDQLLAAVVDRLIEIDVEIRWEDIVKQEEEAGSNGKVYLFHMDLDDESDEECVPAQYAANESSAPGSEVAQQHGLLGPRGRAAPTLDEMADKMDAMMGRAFEHIRARAQRGEGRQVYQALERSFLTTILDTHKSKFTQFLLFYLCSLAPSTCGAAFAKLLCDIVVSPGRNTYTRMSAAAYLASFLARAKYLPLAVVSTCLTRLSSWCVEYVRSAERRRRLTPEEPDPFALLSLRENKAGVLPHSIFYSACQAILYVLCYRLQQLLADANTAPLVRELPLQQVLGDPLNPLATCLESVVHEFERQARAVKLVDLRALREAQKAQGRQLPLTSFGGEHRLDMFFPFDPYLLRQSNQYIKPIFIKWQQPRYEGEESDSDESADSEDTAGEGDEGEDAARSQGTRESDGAASSDEREEAPERMGYSMMSDQSHAWASSAEDLAGTTPVHLSGRGLLISQPRSKRGQGEEDLRLGVVPGSVGMASYRSDGTSSDPLTEFQPMSMTPPVELPPQPSALPSKLPPRLPSKLR